MLRRDEQMTWNVLAFHLHIHNLVTNLYMYASLSLCDCPRIAYTGVIPTRVPQPPKRYLDRKLRSWWWNCVYIRRAPTYLYSLTALISDDESMRRSSAIVPLLRNETAEPNVRSKLKLINQGWKLEKVNVFAWTPSVFETIFPLSFHC